MIPGGLSFVPFLKDFRYAIGLDSYLAEKEPPKRSDTLFQVSMMLGSSSPHRTIPSAPSALAVRPR
jgi:hypothetical protein